jgi:glycosyltransferase involved in cell wall biosynthesis
MISVIIPARNAAGTIGSALASLAADRVLIGEVLLVDDGSDDGTAEAAKEAALCHSLPLTVIAGSFGGAGSARNAGLAAASGQHIFYLDADDVVVSGGLAVLHGALSRDPGAGIAIGAAVRKTPGRADKTRLPHGYGADPSDNARRYLRNGMPPIAMGSALFAAAEVRDIRFPTSIGLDEDTCYWAALLSRLRVVALSEPVLLYHLDEERMTRRFIAAPRPVLLGISLEFNRLAALGMGREVLQWRKAWVALRIARLLIMHRRYREARSILRMARAHPEFRLGWKSIQYRTRVAAGLASQAVGLRRPIAPPRSSAAQQLKPRRTMILTADPAFPPISGADLRNYQNAEAAAQFGPVLLVSVRPFSGTHFEDERIAIAALSREDEPRTEPLAHRRTGVEVRVPYTALPRLLRLVREFEPDAIIVEGIPLFALLAHLRPLARRLVLDMHNIESLLFAQTRQPGFAEQLLPFRFRAQGRIQRQEETAVATVDRVWVCSDADRERLVHLFGSKTPIDVVPNGIPRIDEAPACLRPQAARDAGWPVLLFVGHLGYMPNVVAAERLARNILPLVRRTLPSARLILAGRYPKPAVRDLAALPGEELVADPEDLSPLLARSHISVMPLSEGGGTRIKILEAMAWGLPVIATSIAAEGQQFKDGDEILIAETDAELAEAVTALCAEPCRLERQRRLAYETAMLRHGPSAIGEAVRKGLGKV